VTTVPRAIWSGSVTFGLVSAPVRMYPAIDEHDIDFRLVHVKDGSPIGYRKYCKKEDRAVPDDEVAKAYESGDDLVLLEDEDFAAAEGGSYRAIEILDFVPFEQIDPVFFERTYYLGPQRGSEKVYALLVAALQRAALAGVVRYVFHDRERLGCLRVRDDVLTLERMYFADEIRSLEGVGPEKRGRVDRRELEMALRLIESFTAEFDPGKYEDSHRDRLLEVIETKRRGGAVTRRPPEKPAEAPDLMEALRASLERTRARGNGRSSDGRGSGLGELTVKELAERARRLGIDGRSKMTKRQLVSAIERADR
jgi:DNA end-binding protein Ku